MTTRPKSAPPVRKGATFPIQVSAVCWLDLLGYGAMLADADFNPLLPMAAEAVIRLTRFHQLVGQHASRHLPSLVMNDGAVLFRDLSLRSNSVSYDFLVRCWRLFSSIKESEEKFNLPGVRAVLAVGFRITGASPSKAHDSGLVASVLKRLRSGDISAEQAVREAAEIRPTFGIVRELQANFAFTKAYVAESGGSKKGFDGANFFVDLQLFEDKLPHWLEVGAVTEWNEERLRLSGRFGRVDGLTEATKVGSTFAPGILSGLDVARRMGGLPDFLDALRAAGSVK